jgi:hypothetical protein
MKPVGVQLRRLRRADDCRRSSAAGLSSAGCDQDKQEYYCEGGKAKVQEHASLLSVDARAPDSARIDDRTVPPWCQTHRRRDNTRLR